MVNIFSHNSQCMTSNSGCLALSVSCLALPCHASLWGGAGDQLDERRRCYMARRHTQQYWGRHKAGSIAWKRGAYRARYECGVSWFGCTALAPMLHSLVALIPWETVFHSGYHPRNVPIIPFQFLCCIILLGSEA